MCVIHLCCTAQGRFFFEVHAKNGPRLLQSVMHLTRERALSAIDDCRASTSLDARYQRLSTTSGPYSFHLLDSVYQIIAQSDDYPSIEERDAAIAACKRRGPTAAMQDDT